LGLMEPKKTAAVHGDGIARMRFNYKLATSNLQEKSTAEIMAIIKEGKPLQLWTI